MIRDESMTEEAARFLLKGAGEYAADGFALELGYATVVVKPFGKRGADVWFLRCNDSLKCRSHHVEFGRTGGEVMLEPEEQSPWNEGKVESDG